MPLAHVKIDWEHFSNRNGDRAEEDIDALTVASVFGVYNMCVVGQMGDEQTGRSALMIAAANGCTDCLQVLVNAGADIEAKSVVRNW